MGKNATTFSPARGAGHGGPAKGAGMGLGIGGPARGAGTPFGPENLPSGEAKAFGRAVAADFRARVAERAAEIFEAQLARALDLAHPQGHAAAVNLLDRIMPPESKATLAGDPNAPVAITRIERIIIEPNQID